MSSYPTLLEGALLAGLLAHGEECSSLRGICLSANGGVLLTICQAGHLHAWDAVRGSLLHAPWAPHGGLCARAVALTFDGRFAATVGDDGALAIWDVHNGCLLRRIAEAHGPHCPRLLALAFSQPGSLAITGDANGELVFWSLPHIAAGRPEAGGPHKGRPIAAIAVDHVGHYAVSLDAEGMLVLWEVAAGTPAAPAAAAAAAAPAADAAADEEAPEQPPHQQQAPDAEAARRAQPAAAAAAAASRPAPPQVHALCMLAGQYREKNWTSSVLDEYWRAAGVSAASLDTASQEDAALLTTTALAANLSLNPIQAAAAAGPADGTASPAAAGMGSFSATSAAAAAVAAPRVTSCALSGQQPGLVAAGCTQGLLVLFETRTASVFDHWQAAEAADVLSAVALSASGNLVVTAAYRESCISVWNVDNHQRLYRFGPLAGHTIGLSVAHSEPYFAVATREGTAAIWCPAPPPSPLVQYPSRPVQAVALSLDGNYMAVLFDAAPTGAIYYVDGACIELAPPSSVQGTTDPQMPTSASSSALSSAASISSSSSSLAAPAVGGTVPTLALAISGDGNFCAAVVGRRVFLWYMATGELCKMCIAADTLTTLNMSFTGEDLLTGTHNSYMLLWSISQLAATSRKYECGRAPVTKTALACSGADQQGTLSVRSRNGSSKQGPFMAVAVAGGDCVAWRLAEPKGRDFAQLLVAPDSSATVDCNINQAGLLISTLHANGAVRIWDAKTKTHIQAVAPIGSDSPVQRICLSPCGAVVACASGNTVVFVSTSTRQIIHRLVADSDVSQMSLAVVAQHASAAAEELTCVLVVAVDAQIFRSQLNLSVQQVRPGSATDLDKEDVFLASETSRSHRVADGHFGEEDFGGPAMPTH